MSHPPAAEATPGRLQRLPRLLERYEGFSEAVAALARGGRATFDGAWGSSCALLAAQLAQRADSTLVAVCPQASDLDGFCEDLQLFSDKPVLRFPAWETEASERALHDEICGERLRTLIQLAGGGPPPLAATTIQSLLQPTPAPAALQQATRRLETGQETDREQLVQWLAEQRFHHTTAVQLPGEYSVRGGIVDVFAPDWRQPVRLEFFGDQVESLRAFDIASQRSLASLPSVEIHALQPVAADRGHFSDYLDPKTWFLLIEIEQAAREAESYVGRLERPEAAHTPAEVMRRVQRFAVATAAGLAQGSLGPTCQLRVESVERFSGEIGRVRSELDRVGGDAEVLLVSRTTAEIERLQEILQTTSVAGRGALHFALGGLQQGFRLARDDVVVLSSDQLFQRVELRRPARRPLGRPIDSFMELRPGELVVHLAHGIGRYRGLKLLDKDGQVEEHLEIEVHEAVKVYVPAAKIDLVQKYVGGAKSRPALARVGGRSWIRQKQAAEAAVVDLAAEMLDMQAARAARPGIAFPADSPWQNEFDASFPYQETPDQLTSLDAIKSDMHSARPMDRLLCGDVGFGKTELSMRATFKAVNSGYQVALLAPTTVLAEQHYHTFQQRMAEFPFDVARLSRFCSPAEQRDIIAGIASGRIDVVIGTHRLASSDVRFHNLGLVIIDEEQRFGVEVKERLKRLRTTVNVLTMTATPIPRTLHMSLVGLRDISNLETPPEDRVAVETRVSRFNAELIRHGVLRELNRGGQIYFVHNRVHDIHRIAERLGRIAPEARLGIAHGQMPEGELERVMVDFVAHRFDLLLATTIVENGLDIPNANTIFINEADRYGLADLHQLRGRVGRYKHRAFCCLLIEPHKHITPNAARRLLAIEQYSDIGAGFAIAMRDLEIRGAGNLLGAQQSGHIAAVGYELYCQLLENAVRQLKQQPPKRSLDVDVNLPGQSYLPSEYVPDMRLKIDLYRRFAQVATIDQLDTLREELQDRFGPIPPPAARMLALAELRIDATIWRISALYREGSYLVFRFGDRERVEHLQRLNRGRLRIVDDHNAYLPLPQAVTSSDQILALAKSVLRPSG